MMFKSKKMDNQAFVQVVNVSKNVGSANALILDDINLQIFKGEFVVILGPSGAGKSTLLNIIGGLDRPTIGEVKIGQTVISALSEDVLSSFRCLNVGFIFQTYNLVSTLSALENIQFPMKLAGSEDDSLIESRSTDLLTAVGLMGKSCHLPYELSCGEQQRVAIARSLSNDPSLILADEPTGNLDWATGLEIIVLLKKYSAEQGKTMIIITHDERITEFADVVVKLKSGRIAEVVRHA
jgi:putative ABC transport system ATP-binding protein